MPIDETLVRTILNCQIVWNALVQSPVLPTFITFGLIAFDGGAFPEEYDNRLFSLLSVGVPVPPNPNVDVDDDWIIRLPFCFCVDGLIQQPANELFIQSRSMRKLPPGTGILACLGAYTLGDPVATTTPTVSFLCDVRHMLKSGQAADPV